MAKPYIRLRMHNTFLCLHYAKNNDKTIYRDYICIETTVKSHPRVRTQRSTCLHSYMMCNACKQRCYRTVQQNFLSDLMTLFEKWSQMYLPDSLW